MPQLISFLQWRLSQQNPRRKEEVSKGKSPLLEKPQPALKYIEDHPWAIIHVATEDEGKDLLVAEDEV